MNITVLHALGTPLYFIELHIDVVSPGSRPVSGVARGAGGPARGGGVRRYAFYDVAPRVRPSIDVDRPPAAPRSRRQRASLIQSDARRLG